MAKLPARRALATGYKRALQNMRGGAKPLPDNDVSAALARLAGTVDGDTFLTWIHQQTLGKVIPDTAPEGALRASEARKSFAATIFNLLDRGLSRDASD